MNLFVGEKSLRSWDMLGTVSDSWARVDVRDLEELAVGGGRVVSCQCGGGDSSREPDAMEVSLCLPLCSHTTLK